MSHDGALERRYHRLLALYPAGYRRAYADEMVGVLLASARDGQRRPDLGDAVNLVSTAVRLRVRAAVAAATASDPGWRDALALTSLLAPVVLAVLLAGQNLGWMASLLWHAWDGGTGPFAPAWPVAVVLAPLALGLAGLRRIAALATVALLAWIAVQAGIGGRLTERSLAACLVLLAVQAVALAASPGPRHGLRCLSARGIAVALPWLAIAAYAGRIIPTHYPVPLGAAEAGTALLAVAALPALLLGTGRRLLLLLAGIPGSAFLTTLLPVAHLDPYAMSTAAAQAALYLPPALLAGVAAVAISRSASGPAGGPTSGPAGGPASGPGRGGLAGRAG